VADTKTSALTELAGANVVADDWIPIVDTSVTTTKKLNPLEIKDIPSLGLLKLAAGGASVEELGACEMNDSTIAATGATETLDLATFNVFDLTMDQSCAFTLSNPAASGDFTGAILIIRGAFTPSFSNTMIEPDNTALTYTTPSVWGVWTVNGGTSYFLVSLGKAFA
jgi:hypothetical protein